MHVGMKMLDFEIIPGRLLYRFTIERDCVKRVSCSCGTRVKHSCDVI